MKHDYQPCYHIWIQTAPDKLVRYGDCHHDRTTAWRKLNRLRITQGYDGRIMADSDKRSMNPTEFEDAIQAKEA